VLPTVKAAAICQNTDAMGGGNLFAKKTGRVIKESQLI
jgi:hypothetical protein